MFGKQRMKTSVSSSVLGSMVPSAALPTCGSDMKSKNKRTSWPPVRLIHNRRHLSTKPRPFPRPRNEKKSSSFPSILCKRKPSGQSGVNMSHVYLSIHRCEITMRNCAFAGSPKASWGRSWQRRMRSPRAARRLKKSRRTNLQPCKPGGSCRRLRIHNICVYTTSTTKHKKAVARNGDSSKRPPAMMLEPTATAMRPTAFWSFL
mmetsp:Transcript_5319/g.20034  ORF Transcript_5319/g.20034 Transcript_5319/m.20034 type:complete len:204 (-) Transcript_5319:251-862(-)